MPQALKNVNVYSFNSRRRYAPMAIKYFSYYINSGGHLVTFPVLTVKDDARITRG